MTAANPAAVSLQSQMYSYLRGQIAAGTLPSGKRAPSSRHLAEAMGVSRTTTNAALEQLSTEGWLIARPRSGFYVPPTAALPLPAGNDAGEAHGAHDGCQARHSSPNDILWQKYNVRTWRAADPILFEAPSGAGLTSLRLLIASQLQPLHGLICAGDQVVITRSVHDALNLAGQAGSSEGKPSNGPGDPMHDGNHLATFISDHTGRARTWPGGSLDIGSAFVGTFATSISASVSVAYLCLPDWVDAEGLVRRTGSLPPDNATQLALAAYLVDTQWALNRRLCSAAPAAGTACRSVEEAVDHVG